MQYIDILIAICAFLLLLVFFPVDVISLNYSCAVYVVQNICQLF